MTRLLKLTLASLLVLPLSALAGPIGVGDFSGNETIEDFDDLNPAPPAGAFTLGNLTFSENSSGSGGSGWRSLSGFFVSGSRALTDNAGISDITIELGVAAQRVGLDVGIGPATFQVSFFDIADALLGTVTGVTSAPNGAGSNFFAGWEDQGGIGRVRIVETSGENGRVGGVDNIRTEGIVDVPAPAGVLVLGMLCLAGFSRRSAR